jgi:alpha 1,2-mannosyltransferase
MVIDKSGDEGLNLAALYLASAMMDDKDFWFRMCGGDKDTFRWAWRALDLDFGRSPRWMSSVGIMYKGRFCGQYIFFLLHWLGMMADDQYGTTIRPYHPSRRISS